MRAAITNLICIMFICMNAQEKEYEKIFWTENKTLDWTNFKQNTDSLDLHVAALSFCGIQYIGCIKGKEQKYAYKVNSFFVPELSWVRVRKEYILEHEQAHFDIAELYARKLRKAFFKSRVMPQDSKVEIYDPLFKEYIEFQNLYDKETHHGVLKEVNKKWTERIKIKLNQFKLYKEDGCY